MTLASTFRPRLRPLEPTRLPDESDEMMFALRDPTGISEAILSLSGGALRALLLMDGTRTCDEIRRDFQQDVGVELSEASMEKLLTHLDRSHFLDGERFENHYRSLVEEYLSAPTRALRDGESLGVDAGSGEPFRSILAGAPSQDASKAAADRVVGLIAPHLDYARGAPCYAAAYGALVHRRPPDRVVILGTNHFGRSSSVVATAKAFETPLGTTGCDVEFLEALEARLGSLRRFELDHRREHSVELQVMFLQHLFGAERTRIVPFLCPSPCGPTGTAPWDGEGVDLRAFAAALGEQVRSWPGDTLILAGADLSHVGGYFGDERELDEAFLGHVRSRDEEALDCVEGGDGEAFRQCVARDENPTRVCSAGCIYALLTALPDAKPERLAYHQAVTPEWRNCVTCAAVAMRG